MSVLRSFKIALTACAVLTAGLFALTPGAASAQTEDYAHWAHFRGFEFQTPLTAPLANYPVLLRLGAESADVFREAKPGGADLRFRRILWHGDYENWTDLQLNYQIAHWDSAANQAEIWVLMDTVKPTKGIDLSNFPHGLLMYWGKPDAPARSNAAAVFDTANGFVGVWHMGGASPTAARPNAVPGGQAAVPSGATVATGFPLRQGVIGLADTLRGGTGTNVTARNSDDHFNLGSGYANFSAGATLSLWLKPASPQSTPWNVYMAFGNGAPGDNLTIGRMGNTQNLFGEVYSGTTGAGRTELNDVTRYNEWQHVTFTVQGSEQALYHNGGDNSTSRMADATIPNVARAMAYLGRSLWGDPNPAAAFDEVRLHKVRRSADWVRLDYETQKPGSNILRRYGSLPTPTLTAPAADAQDVPAFPTLSWGPTQNRFRVQLSLDSLFQAPILDSFVANPALPLGPLTGGTYYWRVRSLELLIGTSAWSATRKFTVAAQSAEVVTAPVLLTPAAFAQDVGPGSLQFTWNHASGSTSYQLQLSTRPDFSTLVRNDSTLRALYYRSSLSLSTEYYWRVRGRNSLGPGPWSETRTFTTTLGTPTAPTLLEPAAFAEGLPARGAVLSWSPVNGAASYRVQVSRVPEFTTTVVNDTTLATAWTLGRLEGFTEYYWRVSGKNYRGTGPYSTVRRFTTGQPVALLPHESRALDVTASRVGEHTVLRVTLPRAERVTVRWRDVRGRTAMLARDERLPAGSHSLRLPGAPTGVGLLEIRVGEAVRTLLTAP